MPNKIIYGRGECGEPCRIELDESLVTRIREFHDVFKTLDSKGISIRANEGLTVTIRDVAAVKWEPEQRSTTFFIEIRNDSHFSIMQRGHECSESVYDGEIEELEDIEVSDDLLRMMIDDDSYESYYKEQMEKFFEDIDGSHKLLILALVPAFKERHERDVAECEERARLFREAHGLPPDSGPIH